MSEKRRLTQAMRFSPSHYELRRKMMDQQQHRVIDASPPPSAKSVRTAVRDGEHAIGRPPQTSSAAMATNAPSGNADNCMESDSDYAQNEIDVAGVNENDEIMIPDVGTSPMEIASAIRSYNFQNNIDILEYTSPLAHQIHSLDVIDVLTAPMDDQKTRDCMAGLCVMVNHLISENRYMKREIQLLRSSQTAEHVHRFDNLVFRKRNIRHEFVYQGDAYGIPAVSFTPIVERFDLNATHRNSGAINTIRRFIKFLLENIIPKELHNKFTLRERSGVEHLIECPPVLVGLIRDICLEAVNLGDVITEEDREKREDMGDYINRYIKYALQELRRIPRKAKMTIAALNSSSPTADGQPNVGRKYAAGTMATRKRPLPKEEIENSKS